MTLAELNEHYELVTKLTESREILQSLRDRAYPGASVITGMPHSPGVKDKVGDLASDIADMDARIGYLESEVKASEESIMPYIQSIDDNRTRLIFRLRFLRGMEWKEVAGVVGGHNSADSVRMVCYRYIGL